MTRVSPWQSLGADPSKVVMALPWCACDPLPSACSVPELGRRCADGYDTTCTNQSVGAPCWNGCPTRFNCTGAPTWNLTEYNPASVQASHMIGTACLSVAFGVTALGLARADCVRRRDDAL